MIGFDTFLLGVLIVSTFTGLVTEAIKKIIAEREKSYRSNTIAGIVALVMSTVVGVGYVLFTEMIFTTQIIICLIALIFISWLCAMVGYDKVIQTISQFNPNRKGE